MKYLGVHCAQNFGVQLINIQQETRIFSVQSVAS